jgi:hypothetical protein
MRQSRSRGSSVLTIVGLGLAGAGTCSLEGYVAGETIRPRPATRIALRGWPATGRGRCWVAKL